MLRSCGPGGGRSCVCVCVCVWMVCWGRLPCCAAVAAGGQQDPVRLPPGPRRASPPLRPAGARAAWRRCWSARMRGWGTETSGTGWRSRHAGQQACEGSLAGSHRADSTITTAGTNCCLFHWSYSCCPPTPPRPVQTTTDRLSESRAALEKKAALYDRLARGEVDDEGEAPMRAAWRRAAWRQGLASSPRGPHPCMHRHQLNARRALLPALLPARLPACGYMQTTSTKSTS